MCTQQMVSCVSTQQSTPLLHVGLLIRNGYLAADQTPVSQSYPTPGSCSCRQPVVLSVALTDKKERRLALLQNLRRPKYGSLRDRHCQGGVTLP